MVDKQIIIDIISKFDSGGFSKVESSLKSLSDTINTEWIKTFSNVGKKFDGIFKDVLGNVSNLSDSFFKLKPVISTTNKISNTFENQSRTFDGVNAGLMEFTEVLSKGGFESLSFGGKLRNIVLPTLNALKQRLSDATPYLEDIGNTLSSFVKPRINALGNSIKRMLPNFNALSENARRLKFEFLGVGFLFAMVGREIGMLFQETTSFLGISQRVADVIGGNFSNAVAEGTAKFAEMKMEIISALAPVLTTLINDVLIPLMGWFVKIASNPIVAWLLGLALAFAPVISLVSFAVTGFSSLAGIFGVLLAFLGPAGLIALGVLAIGAAMSMGLDMGSIMTQWKDSLPKISQWLNELWTNIQSWFKSVDWASAWGYFLAFTSDIIKLGVQFLVGLWDTIWVFFGSVDWKKVWELFITYTSEIGKTIISFLGHLWTDITTWFSNINWADVWSTFITWTADLTTMLGTWIGQMIKIILDTDWIGVGKSILEFLWVSISKLPEWLWNAVTGFLTGLVGGTAGGTETDIPKMQSGGYVNSNGLAYLHAGETVVPAGGGMGNISVVVNTGPINSNIDMRILAEEVGKQVATSVRQEVRLI